MQFCDPYGWHAATRAEIEAVRAKLAGFESTTWSDIFVRNKKRNHAIPVGELCAEARKQARSIAPDVDEFHTLRLTGAQRVWGIFSRGVYEIIWWDPNHKIYPTGPNA